MIQQAGRKALGGLQELPSAVRPSRRLRPWPTGAGWLSPLLAGGGGPRGKRGIRVASATRYRPGQAAVAAVLAGAAMAGLLLYLRKRRQVAAHFTMGEGDLEGGNARTLETAGTGRS